MLQHNESCPLERKSSTSVENELLGGTNGGRKKAPAIVQLKEAESPGKERSGQVLKIFLVEDQ